MISILGKKKRQSASSRGQLGVRGSTLSEWGRGLEGRARGKTSAAVQQRKRRKKRGGGMSQS